MSQVSDTASQIAGKKLAAAHAPVSFGDEKRFRHYGTATFGQAKRKSWVMTKEKICAPGPGHYRQLSDFGLYNNTDEWGQL